MDSMDREKLLEALRGVCDTLSGINVPVRLAQQVTVPLLDALAAVSRCVDALEAEPAEEARAIREDEI